MFLFVRRQERFLHGVAERDVKDVKDEKTSEEVAPLPFRPNGRSGFPSFWFCGQIMIFVFFHSCVFVFKRFLGECLGYHLLTFC